MSIFSASHQRELVNQFWTKGAAYCPFDGRRLESHFYPQSSTYLLVLACTGCGSKAQVTRYSDPRRTLFRPWSARERARLAAACQACDEAVCPVCARPVEVPSTAIGRDVLACHRCGNGFPLSTAATHYASAAL